MKLIFKSILLYLFGVYVELYKRHFDQLMDKSIKKGKDISSYRLTKRANNSYKLYMKFREYEKSLKYELYLKKIVKESV